MWVSMPPEVGSCLAGEISVAAPIGTVTPRLQLHSGCPTLRCPKYNRHEANEALH